MTGRTRQRQEKVIKGLVVALLCVSFVSYFSFYYFHLFGHIESFSDFVFALLQWIKLAALVVLPAAVFLKTEKFSFAVKWILPAAALLSLAFAGKYMGQIKVPVSVQQEIYPALVGFVPDAAVLALFLTEAALMIAVCVLVHIQYNRKTRIAERGTDSDKDSGLDGGSPAEDPVPHSGLREKKTAGLQPFLWVLLAVTPLSIFDNLIRFLDPEKGFYRFLLFKNFTVWHFLAFGGVFIAAYFAYRFLKHRDKETRYKYLCVLAIAMLVQTMSKASRLVGDGYNVYYTVIAFIPLFICNIGIPVAAAAIFTRNRRLQDIAFFVHAAGALTVFFYFGKDEMSNYGTVLNYSFLYFAFTHAALFVLCVLPTLLGEHSFTLKRSLVPMAYYAVVILTAAVASELVTTITSGLYGPELAIRPNFAFTQVCPLPIEVLQWNVNLFGLTLNCFYLPLLFLAYVGIFFVHYGGFYVLIERRRRRNTGGFPLEGVVLYK